MTTSRVEYVGFHNNDATRDYCLVVRHPDGRLDEFVVAIDQEAFVSRRARYQDGAEICFLKLSRVLAAWASAPESDPPATRQSVTDADLLEYREVHAAKPRQTRPRRPTDPAAEAARRP